MVRKIFFLILVGIAATLAAGDLELRLDLSPRTDGSGARSIHFYLENHTDGDVTVLTRGILYSGGDHTDSGKKICHFNFSYTRGRYGTNQLVPSLYDLSPVTLKSGEIAMLNPYQIVRGDCDGVEATYEVDAFWGERFNVWHSRIKAKPIELKQAK
ncbi:MAG TPA: hypothetical protein PK014_03925 [Thermoanaerobaculia bacterium]|nr:hypothetical protein [Thermoanaerobaculia bacterium]HUM29204.1 hypothetical protein [Thermoanaerobaculia bacterium]HXK67837.1 hypothetical protein [Thermoanaerobaculia bacterium]